MEYQANPQKKKKKNLSLSHVMCLIKQESDTFKSNKSHIQKEKLSTKETSQNSKSHMKTPPKLAH